MSSLAKEKHELWMKRALALAEKGRYRTSPNPVVGSCVVKGSRLISEGYHAQFGGDHAEIRALKKAGKKARGAVLYVTLEPCSSWGKTPPCVARVVESGVRQVVVSMLDPNPAHAGKGIRILKKYGIQVVTGVCQKESKEQNAAFIKHITTGLPYVTVKMAQSLDGKIASASGHSRWITSAQSRDWVHRLRAGQDAVLVGKNTLFKDDPFLSPRRWSKLANPGKPWRVVLDPAFEIGSSARIFKGPQLTMVAGSEKQFKKCKAAGRSSQSGRVILAIKEKKRRLEIKDLLRQLGALGVSRLLVEGGGELVWSLLEEKLVDRYYAVMSPKIIGGRNAKTAVEGTGVRLANQGFCFKEYSVQSLGQDILFEGRF